jgi:hypothetical protein
MEPRGDYRLRKVEILRPSRLSHEVFREHSAQQSIQILNFPIRSRVI